MKKRLLAGAATIVIALAIDLGRAPDLQWTTRATLAAVHGYQSTLSRVYEQMGVRCRFTPTCSHYSEACIQRFGVIRGGWMAAKRIVRCGPWTPMGTVDPPPEKFKVQSAKCKVQGSKFKVQSSRFKVQGSKWTFKAGRTKLCTLHFAL